MGAVEGPMGAVEGAWLGGRVGSVVGFATGVTSTIYACYR